MNSPITFPPPEPTLKLLRPSTEKWTATLLEERRRLQEDQEALREREDNLRRYEARLRELQAEIEAGRNSAAASEVRRPLTRDSQSGFPRSSHAPFHDDPALHSGWEKFHRAREILEAEQKNLIDERLALQEHEVLVKQREDAATLREEQVAKREAMLCAATGKSNGAEQAGSTMARITRGPFDMARSVLRGKK